MTRFFKSIIYPLVIICCLIPATICQAQTSATRYADIPLPDDCADILLPDTPPYALFIVKAGGVLEKDKLQVNSLQTGKKLWSVPVIAIASRIFPLGCGVLVNTGSKTTLYDYATKEEKFKAKVLPAAIADSGRILIGYQGRKADKLVAYELSSGKQLWTVQIPKNYGKVWDRILAQDSTSAIYIGENLWQLDLLSGECKNIKMKRRIMDNKSTFISGAGFAFAGMMGGAIGGGIAGGLSASNGSNFGRYYFSDLGSNVVTDSDNRLYVADRDAIICADTALNEIWRTPLPKKSGGKSYLRLTGDTLYLLNTGQSATGAETIGESFLAEYDRATGNQVNIYKLPKKWDKKFFGEKINFVSSPLYAIDNEKSVISLVEYPEASFPIATANGDISVVDHNLTELTRYPNNDIFYKLYDLPQGMALIKIKEIKTPEVVIIDKNGRIISTIETTAPMVRRYDGKIATIRNGTLVINQ